MKFLIIGALIAISLAGSAKRTVKYDPKSSTDAKLPCFGKYTAKYTKNKAMIMGGRFNTEKGGDWLYTEMDGKTKEDIGGWGLDENEKWYLCGADEAGAETPSGVKCMYALDQDDDDFCKTDSFEEVCEYNTDLKMGHPTVDDMLAEYEKLRATDTTLLAIYDNQHIFWECEFKTDTSGSEISTTCGKPKLVKTKHDKDFEDSVKCFANKLGGLVSAVLILAGLLN